MKHQQFQQWLRKGVTLSYSTQPIKLRERQTWTPPGILFDLTWVGLLLGLVVSNALLR